MIRGDAPRASIELAPGGEIEADTAWEDALRLAAEESAGGEGLGEPGNDED